MRANNPSALVAMFALILSTNSASATPQDVIYWQTYHIPPITVKTGPHRDKGFVDLVLKLVAERLPQYRHEHPLTAHSRAIEDLRAGKNVCHPALFITEERKKFAYFSVPSMITPPIRLITKQGDTTDLAANQSVKLNEILQHQDNTFGLVKGRSYDVNIDNELATFPPERFLTLAVEEAQLMLKLVAQDRLRYTLAYPFEISYFNQSKPDGGPLAALPIEGNGEYSLGGFACARTPWGKAVIDAVNRVLLDIRHTEAYVHAMTQWWTTERDNPRFQSVVREHFSPPHLEP